MSAPNKLVLSLFPGIGLLDRAFEEAGFCVVRGPDVLWGGDVRAFHPPAGVFAGVIGGPPCQAFSRLRHLVEHNGYAVAENLIPEYERVVGEARPDWFVMENVPGAPLPNVRGYGVTPELVRDVWCGGETNRLRRFCFGQQHDRVPLYRFHVPQLALHATEPEPTVCASGGAPSGVVPTAKHRASRKGASSMGYKTEAYYADALRGQGLPPDFLVNAPFTVAGKIKMVGNGVPLLMGRAVARAVLAAVYGETQAVAA